MRTALLSALPELRKANEDRPAFRRFAGKSVLAHQIDCAALLNCQKVVCLVTGLGQEIAAARQHAQRAGLRFESVGKIVELARVVTAADELLVLADGVLPDRVSLTKTFAEGRAIPSFPSEDAIPLGFERIDATRAWSGAMLIPGASISRLMDMPADCNVASSLLRIALQGGTPVIDADPAIIQHGNWLSRVEYGASEINQWHWITSQVRPASFRAPILAMIERIGLRLAHDVGGGRWRQLPLIGSALALAFSALAALTGSITVGFSALLFATAAMAIWDIFRRVRALGSVSGGTSRLKPVLSSTRDILLTIIVAIGLETIPGWLGWFLAIMAMASIYLASVSSSRPWHESFTDWPLVLMLLLAGWSFGFLLETVAGLALLGILSALASNVSWLTKDNGELTV